MFKQSPEIHCQVMIRLSPVDCKQIFNSRSDTCQQQVLDNNRLDFFSIYLHRCGHFEVRHLTFRRFLVSALKLRLNTFLARQTFQQSRIKELVRFFDKINSNSHNYCSNLKYRTFHHTITYPTCGLSTGVSSSFADLYWKRQGLDQIAS
jgi:hypothetical protein